MADYSAVVDQVADEVRREMERWNIGGVAVALVDGERTVAALGFGDARSDSLFRVGSISKLFNAVGVMTLVERGKLDLDAPLEQLAPEGVGPNPFGESPTLRQILCHRSGLPRESPVGGYFDDSKPGLERSIRSLANCPLVTAPKAKTRYSNSACALAGWIVAKTAGESFEEFHRRRALNPMGIEGAGWTLGEIDRARLAPSWMRVAAGVGRWKRERSPVFDLGIQPAGNLYASAEDLARFAATIAGRHLLRPETWAEMFRPQLVDDESGFGLGFLVGKLHGEKLVSHNGAVYGFSCTFAHLVESSLTAIVLANEDIVNARVQKLAHDALRRMKSAKTGVDAATPIDFQPETFDLAACAGAWESESFWAELEVDDGRLKGVVAGQPVEFTPTGQWRFSVDSRLDAGSPATFHRDEQGAVARWTIGAQTFVRPGAAAAIPPRWSDYIGEYGPDCMPLIVHERRGRLYATTENMVDYRLRPLSERAFGMPPGMYVDELLEFPTDPGEPPRFAVLGNMALARRAAIDK